jgi:DNA polymerase-3 subunit delta'
LQKELSGGLREGPRRVIVIGGADRFTPEAASAMLKTLEEPPPASCFVLLVVNGRAVLPTIVSRCQTLFLRPVSLPGLARRLEGAGVPAARAALLAKISRGWPGVAEKLAEKGESLEHYRQLGVAAIGLLTRRSAGERLKLAADWDKLGSELPLALEVFALLWRDLLMASAGSAGDPSLWGQAGEWVELCAAFNPVRLRGGLGRIVRAQGQVAGSANTRLALEEMFLDL